MQTPSTLMEQHYRAEPDQPLVEAFAKQAVKAGKRIEKGALVCRAGADMEAT